MHAVSIFMQLIFFFVWAHLDDLHLKRSCYFADGVREKNCWGRSCSNYVAIKTLFFLSSRHIKNLFLLLHKKSIIFKSSQKKVVKFRRNKKSQKEVSANLISKQQWENKTKNHRTFLSSSTNPSESEREKWVWEEWGGEKKEKSTA